MKKTQTIFERDWNNKKAALSVKRKKAVVPVWRL